ncbi:MAG: ROK family transcriptional regulator [Chthoniobacterales bacterium]
MARPRLVRDINQSRALLLLKEHRTLSRAAFARALNLTRATVTSVASELLEQGLIVETGEIFVTEGTGRPGQGLKLNPEGAFFLGVAIEVERLSVVVVNLHGQIVSQQKVALENSSDALAVIRAAAKIVREIATKRFKNSPRIRGAGFTIPGMLSQDGIVRLAPLLKWKDVPFREELAKRITIPIFIENDANAAALAEVYFGSCAGERNLCLLMLDIGVGAGTIVDRRIFRGGQGYAGEIGHLDLRLESAGSPERRGFLESVLGRDGLLSGYRRRVKKIRDLRHLLDLLRKGDAGARAIVETWSDWLVLALRSIADIYNPTLVILSGQLCCLYEFVSEKVVDQLQSREFPTVDHLQVKISSFGENSSAVGGAALVYDSLFTVPGVTFSDSMTRVESFRDPLVR